MNFICIFKEYGYELKEMEKYIENCRKTSLKKNNSDVVDKTY